MICKGTLELACVQLPYFDGSVTTPADQDLPIGGENTLPASLEGCSHVTAHLRLNNKLTL
jgi:hypothetical protein